MTSDTARDAPASATSELTREQRVEVIALVLHERRHLLGSAPSCGRCRADAEAVADL